MTIKVFTAFSGYDSQCMALDRLHEHNPHFNSIVVSCMYHIWRRLWIDTHITNLTLF